ncbi:MAG: glycoside hydrolase family 2 TIM barrel-domain containing protein [Rectinemataceae bacterium]|nr:glycoside hydrolase family 2 TIM barrel-domain containing protein [Rectinemataceae bacterium]
MDTSWLDPAFSPVGWTGVDLPHSLVELPLNHFDEKTYQIKGSYAREFETPPMPEGGRLFIDFEAVAVSCQVWLNGQKIGGHAGAYTPFSLELTAAAHTTGCSNILLVEVDAAESPDIPPFGGVVDYLVYGGIYRAVNLRVQEGSYIDCIHARPAVKPAGEKASLPEVGLSVDVTLGGSAQLGKGASRITAKLSKAGTFIAEAMVEIVGAQAGWERNHRVEFPALHGIALWDIDAPSLYDVEVILEVDSRPIDVVGERIGFRKARFASDGFFLNGRRVFLRGLNRHQSWPYSGYAMGPGAQCRDAEILKRELGVAIVRTSHYPQSRHFLDACDELGLLVFTEMPGWQHIGDAAWKDKALADLGDLIRRDRNHPSIILWGVRINESPDDDEFYERTNALAAKLDPDRQRGGVRNFRNSRLLEDVYTLNDFTHDGGKAVLTPSTKIKGRRSKGGGVPYLITEHNGHMFPTKRWDQEERSVEHALRHARVLDAAMGDPGTSGAIGWCAFDYTTHKDFGSGDRICYHGVADMFRIPKHAAALYASQIDPAKRIVLEPATNFAKGERSASRILPIEVFTNCDAIDLYHVGEKVGRFLPDRVTFPHLEHPPVVIDDLIGDRIDQEGFEPKDKKIFLSLAATVMTKGENKLGIIDKLRFLLLSLRRHMSFKDAGALVMNYGLAWGRPDDVYEVVGFLGGAEVARRTFSADARADRLDIAADTSSLNVKPGDEWDCTRVVLRALDQYGNVCGFLFEPLHVEVSGAGRLIGPADLSLLGGATAFWVASIGRAGSIEIAVSSSRFGRQRLRLEAVVKAELSRGAYP